MSEQNTKTIPPTRFDLIKEFSAYEGMPLTSTYTYCVEKDAMLNLIADMVLQGTNSSELWRAVRHSMVVLDAEKHNLDYERSAKYHGIAQLKTKYQGA